jgi:S-DNA-T family DNA segregation ATPase FtsK/SpoIIIE
MNWLTKLVSFFSGEDEKSEVKSQENPSARNVLSTPSSLEDQNRTNPLAEARVAYQYPKGNFKFPIIPDEKLSTREERPRRTASTYNQSNHREKSASSTKRTHQRTTKTEVKKSEAENSKRPFYPTTIPSPIYGYQSKEERILKRPQLYTEKHGKNGALSDLIARKSEKEPLEQNHTDSYLDNKQSQLVEEDHPNDLIFSHENIEKVQSINNTNLDRQPEVNTVQIDDVASEQFTILEDVPIESKKVEDFQLITGKNDDNELYDSLEPESIFNSRNVDSVVEIQEDVEPQLTDYKESELHDDSILNFEDNTLEFDQIVQLTETVQEELQEELNNAVPVETKTSIDHQPVNHIQEVRSKEEKQEMKSRTNTNNTLPINVMMLGRDKQRIQARENSYLFPSLTYLNVPEKEVFEDHSWLDAQRELLDVTLKNFNVRASVVNVTQGPSVTRFEVHPEPGVKVNKITNLSDDIKLSLSARDIRIEAPIPGKNTIGIEVPNKVSKMVYLREILRSPEFRTNPSPTTAVLGLDISGHPAVTDLKKMPHGLIAGATGSGKSVCINTILVSLLYKASPHEVKLMLIDPKMVELAPYNDIPHLVSPVITDVKAATAALKWAVEEMERRYELFAHSGTREITRYNQLVKEHKQGEHLPYLIIIIDELADLMMVAPSDVEEAICRIAQKARACGIHLIVATQRPSVDVITGLIKANIPTRIAFSVSSQVDSRTIIDANGADKLLGKGDMLFLENGSSKAVRLQGTFVSDEEIERVVNHVKLQSKPNYLFHQDELVKKATIQADEDELFLEACEFVVNQGGASTSLLQRRFRIGYNRAARLIDMMEEQGIISENRGSKPRDILISEEELDSIQESSAY